MYPVYKLEVYDYVQEKWVNVASPKASNRPHWYSRILRPAFERLVASAKEGSPNQKPLGYRIMVRGNTVVDYWTNGKVP